MLSDAESDAMEAFVGANANDPAAIGRLQATVRMTRMFVSGEIKDAMTKEIADREANG